MAKETLSAPRGTNDFTPPQSERLERIEEIAGEVFRLFGFRPIRTPIFEHTELFSRNLGETTDVVMKEMYTFADRKGRSLTLRPEGTASVVRALVQHPLLQHGHDRLYYAGPMFRYERPQAGRYRQHHQVGVEAFGDPTPELDVEVIACFVELLRRLRFPELEVRLNSVGVPESRARYGETLRAKLSERSGELCPDCRQRLERNPMRILDCKVPTCRAMLADLPAFVDQLDGADRDHFEAVRRGLDALGIAYRVDPFLVRGFDYYTRTAFEVVTHHLGSNDAVGGGGRYDLLVQELGGPATPGIGFASGVERLMLVLEKFGLEPPARPGPPLVYLTFADDRGHAAAAGLAARLRAADLPVRVHHGSAKLGKQLQAADRVKARFAVVLGARELDRGVVQVKDLASGEKHEVAPDGLAAWVRAAASGGAP